MSIKLLIAAESNSGKTTLTKDLKDSLVISHDGKKYPFTVPHVMVSTFDSTTELMNTVNEKIVTYKEKFGSYPKTIVFDSVSKIFDTVHSNCLTKYQGFKAYSELDREITDFTSYIQNTLIASDMNVILISHAIYDPETTKYNLVGKGSFHKRGGFLAETDQALFIETKSNKRILHFKSTKFPARTLRDADPESMPVSEFNLQDYINTLSAEQQAADEYEI